MGKQNKIVSYMTIILLVMVFVASYFVITFSDLKVEAFGEQILIKNRLVEEVAPQPTEEPLVATSDEPTGAALIMATPPPIYSAKLTFTGDIMCHEEQLKFAKKADGSYDFSFPFKQITPILEKADLTIGNLETTFAGEGIGYSDYPMFNSPAELGQAVKNAGFDVLTTANNHSLDKWEKGVLNTITALDEIGIEHFGTYSSKESRETILVKEVNNIKFAFLSYTYGVNGLTIPENKDYLINLLDMKLVKSDIERAKLLEPDFIIIMPHMGNEYELVPQEMFVKQIDEMLSYGADLVLASHPHVVQTTRFQDKLLENGETKTTFVAYSMGNFISSQRTLPREAGLVLNLNFEKVGDEKATMKSASFVPTWVKFTNTSGVREISIMPVYQTLQQLAKGENVDLRAKDLARVKQVHAEITKQILGEEVPLDNVSEEYSIKKGE